MAGAKIIFRITAYYPFQFFTSSSSKPWLTMGGKQSNLYIILLDGKQWSNQKFYHPQNQTVEIQFHSDG